MVGSKLLGSAVAPAGPVAGTTASPITHVVILIQENHSFDNVLGLLCLQLTRCEGPMTQADGTPIGLGLTPDRFSTITIPLPKATNIVPRAPHDVQSQTTAIDGGKMDAFDLMVEGSQNCVGPDFDCYQAFEPKQIPNLAALASSFVIADHTFQSDLEASWGSHLGFVAGTLDGFYGNNPVNHLTSVDPTLLPPVISLGPGWVCNSHRDPL